jgi:hypothetical protein
VQIGLSPLHPSLHGQSVWGLIHREGVKPAPNPKVSVALQHLDASTLVI